MKKHKLLGKQLDREQQKKVQGGNPPAQQTCSATASCGTNGSVSCTGYATSSGAGCVASDDHYVACPDQNGVVKKYSCTAA